MVSIFSLSLFCFVHYNDNFLTLDWKKIYCVGTFMKTGNTLPGLFWVENCLILLKTKRNGLKRIIYPRTEIHPTCS